MPTIAVEMTETQVTEIVREIQSLLSNPAIDYSMLKQRLEQIPNEIVP